MRNPCNLWVTGCWQVTGCWRAVTHLDEMATGDRWWGILWGGHRPKTGRPDGAYLPAHGHGQRPFQQQYKLLAWFHVAYKKGIKKCSRIATKADDMAANNRD